MHYGKLSEQLKYSKVENTYEFGSNMLLSMKHCVAMGGAVCCSAGGT